MTPDFFKSYRWSDLFPANLSSLLGHSRKAAPSEAEKISSKIGRPCVNIYWGMEPKMRRFLMIFLMGFALAASFCYAQGDDTNQARIKLKPIKGYKIIVDEYGDSCLYTFIRDIYVYPPLKFKNKKQEEYYWRTVRDVRKTLPYAKLAFQALCETYEYIQTIPDKKVRERHLKQLEKDIFEQYKPVVKNMTKTQGKILLKLINRETDQSSFNIVKAFLGSFRAGFWQTFGRFFGMNMKAGFHPEKNKDDALIDRIATMIEQGTL